MKNRFATSALVLFVLGSAVVHAEDLRPLTGEDSAAAVTIAIKSLKEWKTAAFTKLKEVTVARSENSAELTLTYAEGSAERSQVFDCAWKTGDKPVIQCKQLGKDVGKVDEKLVVAAPASWDDRTREFASEDCGAAAPVAFKTLKTWKEEAAAKVSSFKIERTRYSASVKFSYAQDGEAKKKGYVCHWHGRGKDAEIDCH